VFALRHAVYDALHSGIMLEVGATVGGKFRIERILGQGGMGVVAVATHLQLDQLVALKVLREPMVGDAEVIERFLREARASARLRSEHVCKVSDVGQLDNGTPYLVMELLEGSDLQGVIGSGPCRSRPPSSTCCKPRSRSPRRTRGGSCTAT